MARDYASIVATLRAKAAKSDFPEEAKILRAKADELEAKHVKPVRAAPDFTEGGGGYWHTYRNPTPHAPPQTFTNNDDDTVVTSRTGQGYDNAANNYWLNFLLRMQERWNKPPTEDDSTVQDYQYSETDFYDEDPDYGYTIYEETDYESD